MRVRHRLSLFVLSFGIGFANGAWAQPEYRVTVMGHANSTATDINSAGAVVGYYHPRSPAVAHAFINRGKGLVDLGKLGGVSSEAGDEAGPLAKGTAMSEAEANAEAQAHARWCTPSSSDVAEAGHDPVSC